MTDICHSFADWSAELAPEAIPAAVTATARRAVSDTIGVIAAANVHPMLPKLRELYGGSSGPCSAIGCGSGLTAGDAALINGAAAHAWDFDDTSYTGIMHGSAVVFPAILAAAEETGASEEEMLAAFVAGSEVTYTLADICGHGHYFKGWWSTVTFGLTGATAAAAKLYGLSAGETASALGLAAGASGGGKAVFGTDGKPFLVGDAARRAIDFAKVAGAGLSGPTRAFEDERGFLALLNGGEAKREELESLGRRWRLTDPGLLFKTSPVCSAAHAAIEAAGEAFRASGAAIADIEALYLEVPELVRISLVYDRPETPQQAQFSLPYAVACALLQGRVRLEDLAPAEIASEDKRALMELVSIEVSAELSSEEMRARYPESARATLRLKDGSRHEVFCGEAEGMPERPLSEAKLQAKFDSCLSCGGIQVQTGMDGQEDLKTLAQRIFRAGAGTGGASLVA